MNGLLQKMGDRYGWASLSYFFVCAGQIALSLCFEAGSMIMFNVLAGISFAMALVYKGKSFKEMVALSRGPLPWRKRNEQMVSCGVLVFLCCMVGANAPGDAWIAALIAAVFCSLAGSFAMNDLSESAAPVKPPAE